MSFKNRKIWQLILAMHVCVGVDSYDSIDIGACHCYMKNELIFIFAVVFFWKAFLYFSVRSKFLEKNIYSIRQQMSQSCMIQIFFHSNIFFFGQFLKFFQYFIISGNRSFWNIFCMGRITRSTSLQLDCCNSTFESKSNRSWTKTY